MAFHRRPVLLVLCLCVLAAGAYACDVPVYRYALETWPRAPYTCFIFHRGALSDDSTQAVERLQAAAEADDGPNIELDVIDIASQMPPAVAEVWQEVAGRELSRSVWVQRYDRRRVLMEGVPYELRYDDKKVPLGFALKLNRFHIGHYPGTRRPRSFESHVTIRDPATGREQDRIIRMNHPTKHGGYALFQSRYDLAGGRRSSILSVSRDPGLPIAYTGYVAMMVGMVVVLITRALDRRGVVQRPSATGVLES